MNELCRARGVDSLICGLCGKELHPCEQYARYERVILHIYHYWEYIRRMT